MSAVYATTTQHASDDAASPYDAARDRFEQMLSWLGSDEAMAMTESQIQHALEPRGRELMRHLFQGFVDTVSSQQPAEQPRAADGVARTENRRRSRKLMTEYGSVDITRVGRGADGHDTLFVPDAWLALPTDHLGLCSLRVRMKCARWLARLTFEETLEQLVHNTAAQMGKRQLQQQAVAAAVDFDAFYEQRQMQALASGDVDQLWKGLDDDALLVLSFDAKGVPMITSDLRPETRKRALEAPTRERGEPLAPGEKKNRKRMSQVAAVYGCDRVERSIDDILVGHEQRPKAVHKRVWAGLEAEPIEVMRQAFSEAHARDPQHQRRWVVLVDGCRHQLRRVKRLAADFDVEVTIVVDIIHVIEKLWKAARALLGADDRAGCRRWVSQRLERVLQGKAVGVARGMRQSATKRGIKGKRREPVDKCAKYLRNNAKHTRYEQALAAGMPIATGVIEGACRHLVGMRLDISARWSLDVAEAVLRLRALVINGDFDEYWKFHEGREYERNHASRYADGKVPKPMPRDREKTIQKGHLRLIS